MPSMKGRRVKMTSSQSEIRRADQRGATELGWLHSRHSFSFGAYRDPSRLGFRALRVLNDDVVEPGAGFGEHGHDNMEIISWVLEGALAHRDSTGSGGVLVPGDLQVMSAGRGIRHSEMNASKTEPVHFLQIWIEPARRALEPSYEQRSFPADGRRNACQLLVSPDGRDESMVIHQDALLAVAEIEAEQRLDLDVPSSRHGYLHVATGSVRVSGDALAAGDALSLPGGTKLRLEGDGGGQVLFFDLG